MVRLKARVESQAQQAFLIVDERFSIDDVQELLRLAAVGSLLRDEDSPLLLNDKHSPGAVRRLGHPQCALQGKTGENGMHLNLGQRFAEKGDNPRAQDTKGRQNNCKPAFHGRKVNQGGQPK